MSTINWNMEWNEKMKTASLRDRRGGMDGFWNRMAKRHNESIKHADRTWNLFCFIGK